MKFRRRGGGLIAFNKAVLENLQSHRQLDSASSEAGGVLLGRILLDSGGDVVVDQVSEPGPLDKRGRHSFRRSRRTAQPIVSAAWEESKGTRVYLGEWHSHPQDVPNPSCVDEKGWKKTLRKAVYHQDFLLFVIVGRKEVRIWEGNKSTMIVWPLSLASG